MSKGTDLQSFRFPSDLWRRFAAVARAAGTDRSKVLQNFIRWYIGDPEGSPPARPEQSDT
ncbi:hypothetical protein ACPB67_02700 [Micromonospora taraxaci]|uniref:hypothetical protein n=1 Tax=Micromonospora taraxaci TaxID=1316803 RepID=UPI003C2AE96E